MEEEEEDVVTCVCQKALILQFRLVALAFFFLNVQDCLSSRLGKFLQSSAIEIQSSEPPRGQERDMKATERNHKASRERQTERAIQIFDSTSQLIQHEPTIIRSKENETPKQKLKKNPTTRTTHMETPRFENMTIGSPSPRTARRRFSCGRVPTAFAGRQKEQGSEKWRA